MSGSEVQRTPNPRGEGERLRQDLLEAAVRLVDADSPRALTLRGVARGAGVSAPSVYRHFASLPDLMAEVTGRCFEELIEDICTARDSTVDVEDRLLFSARAYLRYAERFPGRYALLFGRGSTHAGPADTPFYDPTGVSDKAFAVLVDAVAACLSVSHASADHATVVATAIWVGLDGFANLRVQRPHFPWPDPDTMLHHLVLDHVQSPTPAINAPASARR